MYKYARGESTTWYVAATVSAFGANYKLRFFIPYWCNEWRLRQQCIRFKGPRDIPDIDDEYIRADKELEISVVRAVLCNLTRATVINY
jgi:hypothetical protein